MLGLGLSIPDIAVRQPSSSGPVAPTAPTLAILSAPSVNTPTLAATGDIALNDVERLQRATDAGFLTAVDATKTVDAAADAANELDFTTGVLADGTWWFRSRTERGALNSSWSNVVTETITTSSPATTWDPSNKTGSTNLTGGNLVATMATDFVHDAGVRAVGSISGSKKAYWEIVATSTGGASSNFQVGIANSSWTVGTTMVNVATAAFIRQDTPAALAGYNGTNVNVGGFVQGDNVGIAVDMGAGLIWFRTNGGNWNNDILANQNPATGTGGISIAGIGTSYPAWHDVDNLSSITAIFSSASWSFTAPAGFSQV